MLKHEPHWYVENFAGLDQTRQTAEEMRARANALSEEAKRLWFDAHEMSRISEIRGGRAIHVNEVAPRQVRIQSLPFERTAVIRPDHKNEDKWLCFTGDSSGKVSLTFAYDTKEEALDKGKDWCSYLEDSSAQE